MGSREDVASKIDIDTKRRIDDMNRAIQSQKEPVSQNNSNLDSFYSYVSIIAWSAQNIYK